MKKFPSLSVLLLFFLFVNALNAQGLISHDFNDGDMGPFVSCTTQNPNYTRVVNNRLRTYWTESSYNSSNRMTKGAEGCGDPVHNGIGYLTYKHCWTGFTMNIDEAYMGSSYTGVGSLAQIFGFNDDAGQFSWTALLEIEDGDLRWIDRRGMGSSRVNAVVYENFPRGVDMDIILHVILSDNGTGVAEVFVNGELRYSAYNIRIGMGEFDSNDVQTNTSYTEFKIGQYNHSGAANNEIRIVDYDNISWYDGEDGYDIVDPSGETIPTDDCGDFDAYSQIEAEDFCAKAGTVKINTNNPNVGYIQNGNWIMFEDVNFTNGASSIQISASSNNSGGDIEIRQGSATGNLLGTVEVESTVSWTTWETFSTEIGSISGVQDIYLVFTGGSGYLLDVNWLKFAEVEEEVVTNEGNLALNGTATQSSLNHGGSPERAIDGNTSGAWNQGSVTHTVSETNPWWQVDLGGNQNIGDIKIFNRTDSCCIDRLTNFTVSVINSSGVTTFSQSYTSYPNPFIIVDADGANGRIVKIQLNDTEPLSLAEVEVYAGEGSTTTTNTITIQENTTGFCAVDGTIDNNHTGHSGTGFANTANVNGNGIDWKINGSAGVYTFEWQYASTSNRSAALIVNGSTLVSNIAFNATGSWASWDTESVTVNLPAGVKEIRLQATNDSGLVNIDYIQVTGQNLSAASCETAATDCAGVVGGTASIDPCGICSGGTTGVNPTSPQTWYEDADGDGAGDPNNSIEQCGQPNGYVLVTGDNCPNDANKNAPGDCGCGVEEGTCTGSECNNTTAFIEAECFDDMQGVVVESSNGDGENLGRISNGSWARYNDINLSNVNSFNAQLSTLYSGRSIEVRLDSENGTLLGTLSVPNTGEWHDYVSASTMISSVSGTHDIFLIFKGGSFNIGSFGFTEEEVVTPSDCSEFFRGITVNHVNPGCSNNDGQIRITFLNSDDHSQIQLSLNGGSSYPVTVNDNSGSYTFTGLSVAEFEVAARYTAGDCEFNIAHVNLVPDCGDIPLNPGGVSWHDSYEANGFCWCSTNFDHDLDEKEITINGTRYNVVDVCDELEVHPLFRNRINGDAIYNDVQCGNGPLNDSSDEPICPGRVDNGADDCLVTGVRWDMEWLAGRSRFGGSSSKDISEISTVNYQVYPNPVVKGGEVIIASDTNVMNAILYDMSGKLAENTLLSGDKMIVNTEVTGLYLLQILFENGSIELVKLIVE